MCCWIGGQHARCEQVGVSFSFPQNATLICCLTLLDHFDVIKRQRQSFSSSREAFCFYSLLRIECFIGVQHVRCVYNSVSICDRTCINNHLAAFFKIKLVTWLEAPIFTDFTASFTLCALHTIAALSALNGSHVSKNYSQKNVFTFLLTSSRAPILIASVSMTRTLSFSASRVFWGREVHI